jgi:predicted CopG family antitoxin
MTKRTTVLLEKDVYDALVKESLEEYKNSKSLSKVLNEIVKRTLTNQGKLTKLLHSKKIARTTAKKFEEFRSELSNSA